MKSKLIPTVLSKIYSIWINTTQIVKEDEDKQNNLHRRFYHFSISSLVAVEATMNAWNANC